MIKHCTYVGDGALDVPPSTEKLERQSQKARSVRLHMQEIAVSLPSPAKNRCGGCRSTLPRMPFAALSQRARARKAARLRRLRPAFFCPRQRQAAILCGNAVQRRKRWIRHNDRVNQRRGEVPSFVVSRMGSRGREIEIPSPGVLSLFVHFLFARAKRKWTLTRAKGHRAACG